MDVHIPPNAFSKIAQTVTLGGRNETGELQTVLFQRATGARNPKLLFGSPIAGTEETRLPCHPQPSLGNLDLNLSLGAKLGRGSSGIVFEATMAREGTSEELLSSLPPLVVKISYLGIRAGVAHDAYYYDFMQAIQGVSIPRCFGYFDAQLPTGTRLVHWTDDDVLADIDNIRTHPYTDMQYEEPTDAPEDLDFQQFDESRCFVSILVLERLGGFLPIGEPLSDSLLQDIDDLYDDLAHMRVWTSDIRYANILRAPQAPPGLPGRVCPFHKRAHEWRLVDFEHGRETNASLHWHKAFRAGWLRRILNNLPLVFYVNPDSDI
ncbi:hypothetical protein PsYK624_096380 [Phanerochaete sordida]|uniref:Protein kinase domain-containing protein n=1 Tax=Phanerochaete sordida TaxID=48140 RepID=A0A9P3GFQ5_9APHY|nr:hypothetical protein PsYK624_096380 [Phanerochaete sordida]